MNGFIFASGVNQPGYPNDAMGAFRPGAEAFKKIFAIPQPIYYFDWQDPAATKRGKILNKIRTVACDDSDGLDVVAYFGHGVQKGLSSADFYRDNASDLASAIASVSKWNVRVVLYACSAGALQESFASALASALNSTDAAVFGHTSAKHAFANPDATAFTGSVGRWVVAPGSPNWSAWEKAIAAGNSLDPTKKSLWARFPFMSENEIRAELGDPVAGGTSRAPGGW
jgi:hypothetical protein